MAPARQRIQGIYLVHEPRNDSEPDARRSVRSFVRRTGRITAAQRQALERLWPRYGIDYSEAPLDLDRVFGRRADRILEIGFGDGESLVQQAAANPGLDFIGIEVHQPGMGHCLLGADARDLRNLRLIAHDAVQVLKQQFRDRSLVRVNLYFPDPWPKKRHHKRRLVQQDFLELVAARLAEGGSLYIATDWQDYAEHIDQVVADNSSFRMHERRLHRGGNPLDRPTTKFERRGLALGHEIAEWRLVRIERD
jgi:tRNA (guanine-N7-)-methyltransferase